MASSLILRDLVKALDSWTNSATSRRMRINIIALRPGLRYWWISYVKEYQLGKRDIEDELTFADWGTALVLIRRTID